MYAHDYDGYLPPYLNEVFGPDCTDRVRCAAAALHTVLSAYVHDNSVWFCPTDPVAGQDVTRWGRSHRYSSYVFCTTKDLSVRDDGHRLPWGAVENPAEYPFVHDSNKSHLSRPDAPDYNPTSGCEHFGGINVWYLDGHLKWVPPWSE
jgi:prepilin-type processing-associated H-X9-DG protein